MVAIIAAEERLSLVDVHRDTTFANQAGLVANILQTSVQNVGELSLIILPSALESKVSCRDNVLALVND